MAVTAVAQTCVTRQAICCIRPPSIYSRACWSTACSPLPPCTACTLTSASTGKRRTTEITETATRTSEAVTTIIITTTTITTHQKSASTRHIEDSFLGFSLFRALLHQWLFTSLICCRRKRASRRRTLSTTSPTSACIPFCSSPW